MTDQERIQAAWQRIQARRIYSEERSINLVAEFLEVTTDEVREAVHAMEE